MHPMNIERIDRSVMRLNPARLPRLGRGTLLQNVQDVMEQMIRDRAIRNAITRADTLTTLYHIATDRVLGLGLDQSEWDYLLLRSVCPDLYPVDLDYLSE